jgi:hypothetical protein
MAVGVVVDERPLVWPHHAAVITVNVGDAGADLLGLPDWVGFVTRGRRRRDRINVL